MVKQMALTNPQREASPQSPRASRARIAARATHAIVPGSAIRHQIHRAGRTTELPDTLEAETPVVVVERRGPRWIVEAPDGALCVRVDSRDLRQLDDLPAEALLHLHDLAHAHDDLVEWIWTDGRFSHAEKLDATRREGDHHLAERQRIRDGHLSALDTMDGIHQDSAPQDSASQGDSDKPRALQCDVLRRMAPCRPLGSGPRQVVVKSQSPGKASLSYLVLLTPQGHGLSCTCADFRFRSRGNPLHRCKHLPLAELCAPFWAALDVLLQHYSLDDLVQCWRLHTERDGESPEVVMRRVIERSARIGSRWGGTP